MGYGSLEYAKVEYARTLAATFTYYLATQRDAVGLLTFHQEIVDYIPARFRPGHMHRLMISLEQSLAGEDTNLERPIEHIAELVSKRGMIVLISDLLAPIDRLRESLFLLAVAGTRSGRDAHARSGGARLLLPGPGDVSGPGDRSGNCMSIRRRSRRPT